FEVIAVEVEDQQILRPGIHGSRMAHHHEPVRARQAHADMPEAFDEAAAVEKAPALQRARDQALVHPASLPGLASHPCIALRAQRARPATIFAYGARRRVALVSF